MMMPVKAEVVLRALTAGACRLRPLTDVFSAGSSARRTKPVKPDVLRASLRSFVLRKEALGEAGAAEEDSVAGGGGAGAEPLLAREISLEAGGIGAAAHTTCGDSAEGEEEVGRPCGKSSRPPSRRSTAELVPTARGTM